MRMIRTLSESDSGQQREEEKKKLVTQWRESDATIDALVLKKQKEISKVMQVGGFHFFICLFQRKVGKSFLDVRPRFQPADPCPRSHA